MTYQTYLLTLLSKHISIDVVHLRQSKIETFDICHLIPRCPSFDICFYFFSVVHVNSLWFVVIVTYISVIWLYGIADIIKGWLYNNSFAQNFLIAGLEITFFGYYKYFFVVRNSVFFAKMFKLCLMLLNC